MKASELITSLQEEIERYGDLPVRFMSLSDGFDGEKWMIPYSEAEIKYRNGSQSGHCGFPEITITPK